MNDTTNRPPLWWAMQGAYFEGRNPGFSDRHGYAAEIRALRDWLVPEEQPPLGPAGKAHMTLRALLTAEADRADGVDHG